MGEGRKLRVISIRRERKEARNSEETERESAKTGHCMKQNRTEQWQNRTGSTARNGIV